MTNKNNLYQQNMHRLKQFILLCGDITMFYAGWILTLFVRYQRIPETDALRLLGPFTTLFVLAILILFIVGLYDLAGNKNNWNFFQKIIISLALWFIVGIIFFYIHPGNYITPKTILLLNALFGFGFVTLWRFVHNRFLSSNFLKTHVVFAGITNETKELIAIMENDPQRGFVTIGCINNENNEKLNVPVASMLSALRSQIFNKPIHLIVIAPEYAVNTLLLQELYQALFKRIELVDLASFYEQIFGRIPPFTFSESWFLTNMREQTKKIYDRGRLFTDYASAVIMGIFFIVTFPIIALAIKLTSSGPILFKQKRTGRSGQHFTIFKYRTMRTLATDGSAEISGPQFAATADARITPVGKFLRRSRLDEIPQFINILRGEMAFIGPRPERPEFVLELTKKMPFYSLRHLIKPGITGWAQLHESYYGTIDENLRKLEYDLYYLKNRGLFLDISILLKTLAVLARLAGR